MITNDWIDYKTGQPVKQVAVNAQRANAGDWESYDVYFSRIQANRQAPAPTVAGVASGDWEQYIAPGEAHPATEPTDPARPVVLTRRGVFMTHRCTIGGK